MVLTLDIGNTNIKLGVFEGDRLIFTSRLSTDRERTSDQYASDLLNVFSLHSVDSKKFDSAIICSVVPEITNAVRDAIRLICGIDALNLESGVKTGLRVRTDGNTVIGADLIAESVGAVGKYPLPCFIADLGTATKILLIDSNGCFCGCTISAGVKISLDALAQKTSLLSSISLRTPSSAIGKNTEDCMLIGAVLGTADMLDGLMNRIESEYGESIPTCIATGGLSKAIVGSCKRKMVFDPDLTLNGLRIIAEKNK